MPPLLKQADKINYALRCEQGDKRLLALKIEPYNLLLFGEEARVPELLRFLFDGGYEIKNYLCASELGYVLMQKMQSYGRCYEEALAMDFMEARSITEPSAPEVETAREDDLDEIFDCAQRFVSDCGLLDKPEKEPFRKILDSFRIIRADGKIVSMARIAPATQDDLRLVLVYTRNEYRGNGYARKVVNSAKNEILTSGKRATLNVDRKNPVSYHLYLSLGFERMFSQGNSDEWNRIKTEGTARYEKLKNAFNNWRCAGRRGLILYRRDVWILPIYDLRRSGYTGGRLLHIDHLSGHCGLYLFYY